MSISAGDVTVSDGYKATYSAIFSSINTSITTDILSITGSATNTIKLLRIGIGGTQSTPGIINIQLLKRSTANTGGSPSSPALGIFSFVPSDPAATATVVTYGAAPTLGTLVGIIRSIKINIGSTTATGANQPFYWFDFANNYSQGIIIRGISEVVTLNTAGVAIAGGSISTVIEWTEE